MVFQSSSFDNGLASVDANDIRKTMISASNESFFTAPLGAMTPAQIGQQKKFIDQLLAVTTDPAGVQALQQSKAMLDARLMLLANSTVK